MTDFEKIKQTRAEAAAYIRKPRVKRFNGVEQVQQRVKKVENDRLVDSIEYVEQPVSKKFDGYKVSDFFLENLLAAGVDLKEVHLNGGASFSDIDEAINAAEVLSAGALNNEVTNND